MFYIYVLRSLKDGNLYVGFTSDLEARLRQHSEGTVAATKPRRPLKLIYFEACTNEKDAIKREKYLKSGFGRKFLSGRLESYFRS